MAENKKGKIIQIRCKCCDKLYLEVKIEGRVEYYFKCYRCKKQNIGVITDKTIK